MSSPGFSPAVQAWFDASFPEPTAAQAQGWPSIAAGRNTLILAPTGSGKTLAAFLAGIDRLVTTPHPEATARTRIVYVSPLRALAFDVEKNLRAPLTGIRLAAERLGVPFHEPTVGLRTGDTSARDRRQLLRTPPDLLITTPESLYLMVTSEARTTLAGVEAVIIDEIHSLAPTKRGAHLALTLERLEARCTGPLQRIGLSATQRPLEEVARFLGGYGDDGAPRPVDVVDAGVSKELDIEVVVPVEDMGELGQVIEEPTSGPAAAGPSRRSIWPAMHPRLLDLILEHRSTLIFCNARRLAERLAARLNELAEERGVAPLGPDGEVQDLVRAHHGSLAREQRIVIEDLLKRGELRGLVATSSLELGIDMGAVDLVVQVESPGAVSTGLQRIGRAGHQVGEASRGRIFPKHRGDLLETAVVVQRMQAGLIEHTRYLRNPLDVLAQQIVAAVAMDDWALVDLAGVLRRAACFHDVSDDVLHSVLDLLAGRYPSEEFRELRPRIVWDRAAGVLRARDGSKRLAVTNGGTIPDRGVFGVFLPDGTRVGELDEEMVYESRAGETFLLGASTWRIEEITFERVVVTPAPGQPGKMPFWRGDRPGRPVELGRALGAFVREVRSLPGPQAVEALRRGGGLDDWAAGNVVRYLDEQAEATGVVPDDRTLVVERFRDEIGDWRVCLLTPFGASVHAPWAMAIEARLTAQLGMAVETMWSDDGIVLRLTDAVEDLPLEALLLDPDEVDELVLGALPSTSLFAARFRECAARALLLPRRRPGSRTPLWQQRQRAADLLTVASRHPGFPILLETTRECLQDVFDVPGLRGVLADIASRRIRAVVVDTPRASPFAQSLLFNWIAQYMYEGDAPLAERRAAALSLDRDLLRDLLGAEELRELIDVDVLAQLELELQQVAEGRQARSPDELHDVLRRVGDLNALEVDVRSAGSDGAAWADELVRARRAIRLRVAGEERLVAAEDAARYRDALGAALPLGLPDAFTRSVERPLEELVARYAASHGPFLTADPATRLGAALPRVQAALEALAGAGRVVRGEFRPGGSEREWCDEGVLRSLRRRSLSALRREVEPVEAVALARFLPLWQGVGADRRGPEALVDALAVLQGASIVASTLEADVLPARVVGYRTADLDALCTAGELVWVGAGAVGGHDGRVRLAFRDQVHLLVAPPDPDDPERPDGAVHDALRARLGERGASFWWDLVAASPGSSEAEVLAALWDLVWAGEVTNDTLAPMRSFLAGRGTKPASGGRRGAGRPRLNRMSRVGPAAGAGRWSLVAPMLTPRPSATEAAHARALQLLDRHGVLTREAVRSEGIDGGFASVYGVLKVLEERGQVRRGYFVAGLGATQFAVAGAVDRLRALRELPRAPDPAGFDAFADFDDEPAPAPGAGLVVLAATDPAQPYGAALPWPATTAGGRPARAAGALVVLEHGTAVAYLDRSGRQVITFEPADGEEASGAWVQALGRLVHDGRLRSLELRTVDGVTSAVSTWAPALRSLGFAEGYRGLVLRS